MMDKLVKVVSVALHECNHNITPLEIMGKRRDHEVCVGRHMVMFIARTHYKATTVAIGAFLDKNHSTVVYCARACENLIERDALYGKVYLRSCQLMGIEKHEHLIPEVKGVDKPLSIEFRKPLPVHHPRARKPRDEGIVINDWTPEQRAALAFHRNYPGWAPIPHTKSKDQHAKAREFQRATSRNGYK